MFEHDNQIIETACENHEQHKHESLAMPSDEHLFELAEFFSVIGDSTRIKILYALFESELCVCDISEALGMTLSAISHQLKILKTARLVKFRKVGKSVFYSLDDDHVKTIINMGNQHINEIFGNIIH